MEPNHPRERDAHCHGGGVSPSPRGPSPKGRGADSACDYRAFLHPSPCGRGGGGGGISDPPLHWPSSRGYRSSPIRTPALNTNSGPIFGSCPSSPRGQKSGGSFTRVVFPVKLCMRTSTGGNEERQAPRSSAEVLGAGKLREGLGGVSECRQGGPEGHPHLASHGRDLCPTRPQ